MEKYYQPNISEFHIGFEYQFAIDYYEDGKQFPKEHENSWLSDDYDGTDDLDLIALKIESKNIRVKYLDREDIEGLGFVFDKLASEPQNEIMNFEQHIKNMTIGITVVGDQDCVIYHYAEGREQILFMGVIKNKSELKKLMQQLQIL